MSIGAHGKHMAAWKHASRLLKFISQRKLPTPQSAFGWYLVGLLRSSEMYFDWDLPRDPMQDSILTRPCHPKKKRRVTCKAAAKAFLCKPCFSAQHYVLRWGHWGRFQDESPLCACVCVYVYIYIYICVCVCIYIYIHKYLFIYLLMYLFTLSYTTHH